MARDEALKLRITNRQKGKPSKTHKLLTVCPNQVYTSRKRFRHYFKMETGQPNKVK